MTLPELVEVSKVFGVPGGIAMMMFYLWITRQRSEPVKSQLERDIEAIRAAQTANVEKVRAEIAAAAEKSAAATAAVADELHDIRDRVSRIEGKLEK